MQAKNLQNSITVLGVEMLSQAEVGKLLGIKASSTVSDWLARAGIAGITIKGRKYFSSDLIKDYLRYGKLELRQAVEILREIKIGG